jgi:hypothetical protein
MGAEEEKSKSKRQISKGKSTNLIVDPFAF